MKSWLRTKWETRRENILMFFLLLSFFLIKFILSGKPITHEGIGLAIGTIAAFVVWFGSVIFVDIRKIKVRRPKDTFVEPSQLRIGLFLFTGMAIAAVIGIFIIVVIDAILIQASIENAITDAEGNSVGVFGNAIMMFYVLSIVFSPFAVYMLNANLRYIRIVEHNTPEWTQLQKRPSRS